MDSSAYSREYRKRNPNKNNPSDEEGWRRHICRSQANVYKRLGKLIPQPCCFCGREDAQMHHDDYSKPLEVEWMCQACHRAYHVEERRQMKALRGV